MMNPEQKKQWLLESADKLVSAEPALKKWFTKNEIGERLRVFCKYLIRQNNKPARCMTDEEILQWAKAGGVRAFLECYGKRI